MTEPTAVTEQSVTAGGSVPPLRKNADFIRLWVSSGISRLGTSFTMVAYPLLALWHTGSASDTGLVTFAAALPSFLVQLPAGALVDRVDRRRLMLWCDVVGLLAVGGVAAAEAGGWFWLPGLMVAAFVQAALVLVGQLAERAMVRHVVAPGQLPEAMAQNEVRGAAIGLLGQPGSGLLFTLARWLPFAVNAVANAVAVLLLLLLRRGFKPPHPAPRQPLHVDITEGLRWLWQRRYARRVTGVFAGSNLVFQVLLLAVMVTIRKGGHSPTVVGVVLGAGGVGGVLGALHAPWATRRLTFHRSMVVGFALWTMLIPLAVATSDPVALACILAGISYVASLFNVIGAVYQMRITPDELQGRVSGASSFLLSGANAVGAVAGGYVIECFGVTATSIVVGAFVLFLTVLVAVTLTPAEGAADEAGRT
ncbi:MFS transporter [Streptomyces filipinensis]|uniref:MFS transporter n=1 Tax=Streptomyces filipinensis TaxID=66887 RepID=A0A918IKB6_9ACTN|nr:MFS transporter [Streptomyces filipinensis]GGV24262.1 MFS transporter [Streptomyces filipinensis]